MSSNNLSSLYGLALLLTWCHTALFFTIKSGRREDGNVISLKVVYYIQQQSSSSLLVQWATRLVFRVWSIYRRWVHKTGRCVLEKLDRRSRPLKSRCKWASQKEEQSEQDRLFPLLICSMSWCKKYNFFLEENSSFPIEGTQGMCLPKRVLKRDARFLSEDYFHLLGHFPS